jgi:hypothetical protein
MRIYWRVQSHGFQGAVVEKPDAPEESEYLSLAQEIFQRLSKRRQQEVMRRAREIEELPSSTSRKPFGPEVAKPPGVGESAWLAYLTVAAQEEHLRLRVVAPIPWALIKAVYSEGLVVHPDFEELSPWSAREFGERLMGWRPSGDIDWPDRHSRAMLRRAFRRIGRALFREMPEFRAERHGARA